MSLKRRYCPDRPERTWNSQDRVSLMREMTGDSIDECSRIGNEVLESVEV